MMAINAQWDKIIKYRLCNFVYLQLEANIFGWERYLQYKTHLKYFLLAKLKRMFAKNLDSELYVTLNIIIVLGNEIF